MRIGQLKVLNIVVAIAVAAATFTTLAAPVPVRAAGPVVVTPASADWQFVNDNGTSSDWTVGFENGPGTPPLGVGSVQISLSSASAGIIFGSAKYGGTRLADLQALSYSTYTNSSPQAMAFQINYDPDVTVGGARPWFGRLVYEPYINGTVTNGTWQTWDMLDGGAGKWWASGNANSPVDDACPQASPCTWSTIISTWPNIGVRNDAATFIGFKAGSNWNGFHGNADNFSIEIASSTDTYDFEPPSAVYVNGSWAGSTPGSDPDGAGPAHSFGGDAFDTIQGGVDAVASGGTVHVAAGTYAENVTIPVPLILAGAGQSSTKIIPAVSDPNCGGAGGGSLCPPAGSNVLLVQADDVTIHDLTVDGDNPSLTSAYNVGGANIDARNGIITNHVAGTYNNLTVYKVTVKNVFLRGMYDSTGSFNFHDNTVTNVRANPASIAMFAWFGPGVMQNNQVSYANDAISANHSKGIQFLNNKISHSGSGVHTDNAGDSGGSADLIQGNKVSDCDASNGGYGIFVFVPYIAPTVQNNTISDCLIGLSAWGQGTAVTTHFTGNKATGPGKGTADSVGAYITTDMIGYGYSDVAADFSGNVIKDFETGVQLTADAPAWEPGPFVPKAITATFHCNQIDDNGAGAILGVNGTITNDLTYNWWGSASGPAASDNPGGTGNSVADGIVYNPWLTTTACASAPFATKTSIVSQNPNPSAPGQNVTIQVNVKNAVVNLPVPAGTVDVKDGSSVLCSAVALDGSGNASCSFAFSSSGAHFLSAVFTPSDPGTFQPSTGTAKHIVTNSVTRFSTGSQDGWVLESSENSGHGGSYNSTAPTFSAGDDNWNRQYRDVLSFNTQLPAGAVVTQITLTILQAGSPVGTNPFSVLGSLLVDIKKGTFGSSALAKTDFEAPASKSAAFTVPNTPSGGWYSGTLGATADSLLNKSGTTQLRLRFSMGDNNDHSADLLNFFSGNASPANRPQLIIEYYVP